ncbi:MAG: hypothetical protein LBC67_05040 [Spirochaetales bacterium]|jgi:hypothetical protein|nr:hypothetical protein [Spirochaetales bacterium]
MDVRLNKTYFLAPLLYAAVIFGLLFLQFARQSERFFDSVFELALTGTASSKNAKKAGGREIQKLDVRYRGINFSFGGGRQAELVFEGGESFKLNPRGYERTQRGFILKFDHGVRISFVLDDAGEFLSIQASLGKEEGTEAEALLLRFGAASGVRVSGVKSEPALSLTQGEKTYRLALPENSKIDMARQLLVVAPREGAAFISFGLSASVETAGGAAKESFRQSYAARAGENLTSAEEFARVTDSYISRAYQGWKQGRSSPAAGENSAAFAEKLAMAYLAEALVRGEYASALKKMEALFNARGEKSGFALSPFMGNVQDSTLKLLADDRGEAARLLAEAKKTNSSLWERGGLLRFAVDRGGPELADELVKLAGTLPLPALPLPAAIGLLENYYTGSDIESSALNALRRSTELIGNRIFPAIITIPEGSGESARALPNKEKYFLETGNGKIGVYESLRAGRVLILAGEAEKDPVLESIGRDLIISSLALADQEGFLPRNIVFSNGVPGGPEGRLAPEDVYTLLVNNPYYPRFTSLSRQIGRGTWLYAAADIQRITITPQKYEFLFQFPAGETHRFVFRGAKSYTAIQLWKIPWRVDPHFESYKIGAYFLPEERLFMAKYNHRSREEDFVMSFDAAGAPPAGLEPSRQKPSSASPQPFPPPGAQGSE